MTAIETLGTLRIEDGRRWVDAAHEYQLVDARAILSGADRPFHFLTRPRGGSKTTDLAAVALALLLDVRSRERLYWLAADREQGQLAIDAAAGFLDRSPGLRGALTITSNAIEATATGARLAVLPADAASSWGLNPHAVFCDEICQWSDTAGPRQLWESVSSAVAKRADAKLVVLSTAGDPGHFARKILDAAQKSELWRVHEVPGPSPWMDDARLAEQKARLLPSVYRRLFLNEWASPEDRLTTGEQLRECVTLDGPLDYNREFGGTYLIAVDLGLKRDRSVCAVCHREGRKIVLDRMAVWAGTSREPVQLETVEAWIVQAARTYSSAKVVADPWQATGMAQRLRERGLAVDEFSFTAQSVGRLAASLFNVIRDKAIALPDDEELLDELAHVRLRETSPGVFRMDHDSGRHDDRAVALALAVTTLLQGPPGAGFSPGLGKRLADAADRERTPLSAEEELAEWQREHGSLEQAWSTTKKTSIVPSANNDLECWP